MDSASTAKTELPESVYRYYFDATDSIFIVTDENLKIIAVNKVFIEVLGYQNEELYGRELINFIYPDDRYYLESLKKTVDGEGKLYSIRFTAKDNSLRSIELHAGQTDKYILLTARDLTEEKANQDKLFKQNLELESDRARDDAMLTNIGDGIIGVNDRGEITFINDQAVNLLGFGKDEVMGKVMMHVIRLVDDKSQDVPVQDNPVHKALLNKIKLSDNKYSFVKKDGLKLPISFTATPIILHELVTGGIVIFRDITKEREVDKMKTEFISLASHQLRTPLSAMKWFAELLLDGNDPLTEEQKDLIQNIFNSNERMIDLVNSLLNISRIESGRIIIEPTPTDLKELVGQVVLELQPKIMTKKHQLVVNVPQELPKINIDPKLVRHVYMNLLTNAIKYTQSGGEISVTISKEGEDIISRITDNGFGIPELQQKRVFEKFFRAENAVKVETDGTGLGLYLVKTIVESSGGRIWFESKEDKGTNFWFSLPVAGTDARKGEVSITP